MHEPFPRVRELKNFFHFTQGTGDKNSLNREIRVPDVNRPGLELAGYNKHSKLSRIVILGDKETSYIKTLNEVEQRERFDVLTSEETPAIIISKDHSIPPILKEIAVEKNFPILQTSLPTYRLMVEIIGYLDEAFAPTESIHGVLVSVYGKGVLIIGDSGMGKSETALELIKRGHVLIADDRVEISRVHNRLVGNAPELLSGILEVRGIGVINVMQMFGASSILDEIEIDVVIKLETWDINSDYDRLGADDLETVNIMGIEVPRLVFPVKVGRNLAVLVETGVTNFTLKQMGFSAGQEFDQRVIDYLKKKKREESK